MCIFITEQKREASLLWYWLREGIRYGRDLPLPSTESHPGNEAKVH